MTARSPRSRRHSRPGYALTLAIITFALVALFVVILERYAILELTRERQYALEACAAQAVESTRAWTLVHASDLSSGNATPLPLDALLPRGSHGQAEVQRVTAADGQPLIECRLTLQRGSQTLSRHLCWPLPAATMSHPASAPATP